MYSSREVIFVTLLIGLVSRAAQGAALRVVHCRDYISLGRRIFIEHDRGVLNDNILMDVILRQGYSINIRDDATGVISTLYPEVGDQTDYYFFREMGFANGVSVTDPTMMCDPYFYAIIEAGTCSVFPTNNWVIFDIPSSWNTFETAYTIVSAGEFLGGNCKGSDPALPLYPAFINLYSPAVLGGNGAIEVRHCRKQNGAQRVFVEHTHGPMNSGILFIDSYYPGLFLNVTHDLQPPNSPPIHLFPAVEYTGPAPIFVFINGIPGDFLTGCDPLDSPPKIASTCSSEPATNNWIVYDFPPTWTNTDITYAVEHFDYFRKKCKKLFPAIIDLYGPSLEPSFTPSSQPSAPTIAPTASPTAAPSFPVMKICDDITKRSSCNDTEGCSWESDGEGGGTCNIESSSPNCQQYGKRKPCIAATSCFWKSKGDGTGRCRECTSLEKKNKCERQQCTWENDRCK